MQEDWIMNSADDLPMERTTRPLPGPKGTKRTRDPDTRSRQAPERDRKSHDRDKKKNMREKSDAPCKYWLEGICNKENECPFAHSGSVDKKLEMCKFYLNSHCAKGKACIFMHEEYPCKFFHLGMSCYSGGECKFSHAALDDVTGPMLEKEIIEWVKRQKKDLKKAEPGDKEKIKDDLDLIISGAIRFDSKLDYLAEDSDSEAEPEEPKDDVVGEEMDFDGFIGPYGMDSYRRYAYGTYGVYRYAMRHREKFEAYEEVERRLLAFYKDMYKERRSYQSERPMLRQNNPNQKVPLQGSLVDKLRAISGSRVTSQRENSEVCNPRASDVKIKVEANSYIESIRKNSHDCAEKETPFIIKPDFQIEAEQENPGHGASVQSVIFVRNQQNFEKDSSAVAETKPRLPQETSYRKGKDDDDAAEEIPFSNEPPPSQNGMQTIEERKRAERGFGKDLDERGYGGSPSLPTGVASDTFPPTQRRLLSRFNQKQENRTDFSPPANLPPFDEENERRYEDSDRRKTGKERSRRSGSTNDDKWFSSDDDEADGFNPHRKSNNTMQHLRSEIKILGEKLAATGAVSQDALADINSLISDYENEPQPSDAEMLQREKTLALLLEKLKLIERAALLPKGKAKTATKSADVSPRI